MDFSLSDDQQSIAKLAAEILGDHATHERLNALEAKAASGGVWDPELWAKLAEGGLTALAVPEAHGGSGLGFIELGVLLEELGKSVAPVPAVATLVLGALPVTSYGTEEQKTRLLPGVADGSLLLTAALAEPGETDPLAPTTTATKVDGGWKLSGEKAYVPYGAEAAYVLMPAATPDGVGLFLVAPGAAKVTELSTTNREPLANLVLDDVVVPDADVIAVGDGATEAIRYAVQHGTAALCMLAQGAMWAALRMTAKYTGERKQWDKPIAEFQAVAQRAADAFIDAEVSRLTAYQAVWRLAEGHPAADEIAVAKFWAGDGGGRVVHAAQHLHGGIGVDMDYPLHRYFLWIKQIEHTLGTPTRQLVALGASLAAQPV